MSCEQDKTLIELYNEDAKDLRKFLEEFNGSFDNSTVSLKRYREDTRELTEALEGVMKYVRFAEGTVNPYFFQIGIDVAYDVITKYKGI